MCRRASRMTTGSVTWCVMRGSGEALEISSRALSAPIISLAPHPLTVLTSSHLAWPLVNLGLHQWFILSVAAIKFMICQFKIVNGNMDFLQRLNNWVIHTSSISGYLAWEGGVSEARGRGMWRCNYQSFSLNKWQWEVGGVVRRKVLLLVVSSVGLFLSYQWWPTLGEGESFLFTSHTMLLSPCYKCYMFHVLSEFRSDKFQNKQI